MLKVPKTDNRKML